MPPPPPDILFLRLTGEIRGPFGRQRLRELAETGVITPATEAAEQRDGPWQSVGDLPGGAELFPERARLQFKAREFEHLNQSGTLPVDHRALIAAAQGPKVPRAATAPAKRPGDIEEILRLNREREKEAGLDQLKPQPRRPNRRRRDYLFLMTAVNGFFAWSLFGGWGNPVFSIAGIVIFSIGITWIMYVVMDRY